MDLNRHVEDFIKEVLNLVLDINLRNLNEGNSNEPGIDLGGIKSGWAFQVTSDRSSEKVNTTLEKLTDEQVKAYSKIRILIVGSKQRRYSSLDTNLSALNNASARSWRWISGGLRSIRLRG
jgi:hypothetical protein